MKCCVNCFNDTDVQTRIRVLKEKGNCDFCGSQNVWVLDIERAKRKTSYAEGFIDDFGDLVDQFVVDVPSDSHHYGQRLSDSLLQMTTVFNLKSEQISRLLKAMLTEKYVTVPEVFDGMVVPSFRLSQIKDGSDGIFYGKQWRDFEQDIKFNNRFHSKMVNEDKLLEFFHLCERDLISGKRYVRARISPDGKAIPPEHMGSAPVGLASSGRLNASGIGYLYLSSDQHVALAEIKAAVNDVCTIATFEVTRQRPVRVVDLSQISQLSIFQFSDKDLYLMNLDELRDLDRTMRATSGQERSEVAYVPTEYMSDLIKSMGVDGIMYDSTLRPDVQDLVLFNEDGLEQIDSELVTYRISGLDYSTKRMSR